MTRSFIAAATTVVMALTVGIVRAHETVSAYSVQVSAVVETSPASITLRWPQDAFTAPRSYTVHRRVPGEGNWGNGTVLPGGATNFVDLNVAVGTAYEYQIVKTTAAFTGYGYICAGIRAPLSDDRGKVVLVVDNTHAVALGNELARLQSDLAGDGWLVLRHDVARTDSVVKVKSLIKAEYDQDPAGVKAVFLFGHVPVPYSGSLVPDGHYPNHYGAWPADAFYADMDGEWTDASISNAKAREERNRNVPGDGKFDQSEIPSPVELQIGRVDLANMPGRRSPEGGGTFASEVELLRQYLNKDHNFRHKRMTAAPRALIHDSFGLRGGEAFAASGYRSFAPFFGAENITTLRSKGEWISTLRSDSYLWAYGCGAGTYTSIDGLGKSAPHYEGTTVELVETDIKAVFTMLYGSWLGDWDSEDNLLRAVLATPTHGLVSLWSGRPHWFMHHMALGENIGYSVRLAMNNKGSGPYRNQINSMAAHVQIGLMGDPTLRMHPVAPPSKFSATASASGIQLAWNPSSDTVLGYHVYRAASAAGPFTRLTASLIEQTHFTDPGGGAGTYMVRAVKLETSASGTYYNPSQGVFCSSPHNPPATPVSIAAPSSPPPAAPERTSPTGREAGAAGGNDAPKIEPASSPEDDQAKGTLTPSGSSCLEIPTMTGYPSPSFSVIDGGHLQLPNPGDHALRILSPTVLELKLINTKPPDPARVTPWDFVNGSFNFVAPALTGFAVTINGQPAAVQSVGFRRRPLYAPLAGRDLRIDNSLFLLLANPVADGQRVEVRNPTANLWPSSLVFSARVDPLRYSPAIHVNQEGYTPSLPKKAMVGYYLGNLGEMNVPASLGFTLIVAGTGETVYQGALVLRPDVGYSYTPTPYQKVLEADFSSFSTPGEYQLVVPTLGASLPFRIHEGLPMNFARAYALGLYHQRCGAKLDLPHTRHGHGVCHTNLAEVPSPQTSFAFTWTTIAEKNADFATNPRHIAPQLKDEASQLYPFVNKARMEIARGHHDAGDYSKYTINSCGLIHYLMFAVDSFPGVAALDNLGLPNSGNGISDLMEEAKWEADYLAKIQDTDGGFYFLVYPKTREYESDVMPENGDAQVVWPKNTAATAGAVAALAQTASSPHFRQAYPAAAALYMQKAHLGWKFLTNAIARHGKDGSYQMITFYGDEFMHDDELAWAACEMFLATGEASYHQKLKEWMDPGSPGCRRWGWWRMFESYGRAIRSYAFGARSGRLQAGQLDLNYRLKCETETLLGAQDHLSRARDNAYATSFPLETKSHRSGGWYFSSERAFDITVAYQMDPRPSFLEAIVGNMNYEGGCNPVNVSYITGLGWKRQREIVHQCAQNDRRVLPPSGLPLGNIQSYFPYYDPYQTELRTLCFPQDDASTPYPFYDRWSDAYNVTTEFVHLDLARSLASLAFLATLTPTRMQHWASAAAHIVVDANGPIDVPRIATLSVPGLDLTDARIVWEARDHAPAFGQDYTLTPTHHGLHWIEAEAHWPDGRRVFASMEVNATNSLPTVGVVTLRPNGSEVGPTPGAFLFTRTGNIHAALTVNFRLSGTATKWNDYRRLGGDMPDSVIIPAGAASTTLFHYPVVDTVTEGTETVILTLTSNSAYNVFPASATHIIAETPVTNPARIISAIKAAHGIQLTWESAPDRQYRVCYRGDLLESNCTTLQDHIPSGGNMTMWADTTATSAAQRFYFVIEF